MPPKLEPISVRTARLNNLILGKGAGVVCGKPAGNVAVSGGPSSARRSIIPVPTTSAAVAEAICREGLLDAFCLLYNECDKDTLKKRDRNIAEFVNKCESTQHTGLQGLVLRVQFLKGFIALLHLPSGTEFRKSTSFPCHVLGLFLLTSVMCLSVY